MGSFNTAYLKTPSGILKFFEIVFVCIAFGIFRGAPSSYEIGNNDANYFACGALVMGLVITPLLLVCYLMGKTEIQKTIMEVALNFLLCVFLIAAGGVGANYWSNVWSNPLFKKTKDQALVMSSFTIMAGIAYGVDTVFAVMLYRK